MSLIGALAFLVQNYSHQRGALLAAFFIIFASAAAVSLVVAMYFFVKSWMGTEYFFLPPAVESEAYRQQLINHFAPYETDGELSSAAFNDYIMDYYVKYSSKNTDANDTRSLRIHKTNVGIKSCPLRNRHLHQHLRPPGRSVKGSKLSSAHNQVSKEPARMTTNNRPEPAPPPPAPPEPRRVIDSPPLKPRL